MDLNIKTLDRICLITVVLISLVCGYWAVSRGVRQQRQIRLESELLSESLKDFTLVETNLQRLDSAIAATRKEIKTLNERIPDSAKIGEFLKQLDAVMKEREIVLESFHQLPVVQEKLYTRIPIQMISRGSFINIYHLLYDLETMNRMVEVDKIIIRNPDAASECQLDMTTSIFERQEGTLE